MQHGIATIGKPLGVGIEPPLVARPGTAVGKENQGEVLGRYSNGQSQIAVHLQPVAGGDDDGFHFRQPQALEFRLGGEEEYALLRLPVPAVKPARRAVGGVADQPDIVSLGAIDDDEIAGKITWGGQAGRNSAT